MLTYGITGFIVQYGNGTEKQTPKFDPIADSILSTHADIRTKRDSLEKKAEVFLKEQMDMADKVHHEISRDLYYRAGVGGVFISDSITDYGVYAFHVAVLDWKSRKFDIEYLNGNSGKLSPGIPIIFGNDQGWMAYQSGHTVVAHNPTEQEAVNVITTVLQLQTQKTPNDVGPPFAIALLKADGLNWLKPGYCNARSKKKSQQYKKQSERGRPKT